MAKICVITGASYGLGNSLSKLLLKNKFKVYGISRSDPKINEDNFVWVKADLLEDTNFKFIESVVVENEIDLLINCAGVVFAEKALEFKKETFDKIFGLNLIAPIKLTAILKSKLQKSMIINISSTSDRFVEDQLGMYCASKAALDIYFDAIAIENNNLNVINVLPVYIDTPMLKDIARKLNFSTDDATSPDRLAESIISKIITSNIKFESGIRIMFITNKSLGDTKDPERLWYYNIDSNEFKKLK